MMDYAQRQKFALQIALAAACVTGIMALICVQAPEGDKEWELNSTTAEMAESVINVCYFSLVCSHSGLMVVS